MTCTSFLFKTQKKAHKIELFFEHLKYFLYENGVCFSQSRGFQFQISSWPVGPNQGGASLDTMFQKTSRTPAGGLRAPRPSQRIGQSGVIVQHTNSKTPISNTCQGSREFEEREFRF